VPSTPDRFARRLGPFDAVVVGLTAMVGAGVFTVWGPASAVAGPWLMVGLLVAAVVAWCNATSTARLAALMPEAGGTYVYGTRRLGPFWGHLAGWSFVVGKTASCAAMALTFGTYVSPEHARALAVIAVVAVTALGWLGVQRAAWFGRAVVAVVLTALATVAVVGLSGPRAAAGPAVGDGAGVLTSAGLLFFAFAGYARIATLGEEVRDPERTIRRAVPIALAVTLGVYAVIGFTCLWVLGPARLARSTAPIRDVVESSGLDGLAGATSAVAAIACLGALLALALGVSRTTVAMARDRHLPTRLARIEPGSGSPRWAEGVVGLAVVAVALLADTAPIIGLSSFGVLLYYAVANASARTLTRDEGRPPRVVPILGLVGCLTLAVSLPLGSVVAGTAVVVVGVVAWLVTGRSAPAGPAS